MYTHEEDLDCILFLCSDSLDQQLQKRKNSERVVVGLSRVEQEKGTCITVRSVFFSTKEL